MPSYPHIFDYLNSEKFPSYSDAKEDFVKNNKYNSGVEKALDEFYDQIYFKRSKTRILRTKKGRIVVMRNGKFARQKGYARYINQLKKK